MPNLAAWTSSSQCIGRCASSGKRRRKASRTGKRKARALRQVTAASFDRGIYPQCRPFIGLAPRGFCDHAAAASHTIGAHPPTHEKGGTSRPPGAALRSRRRYRREPSPSAGWCTAAIDTCSSRPARLSRNCRTRIMLCDDQGVRMAAIAAEALWASLLL